MRRPISLGCTIIAALMMTLGCGRNDQKRVAVVDTTIHDPAAASAPPASDPGNVEVAADADVANAPAAAAADAPAAAGASSVATTQPAARPAAGPQSDRVGALIRRWRYADQECEHGIADDPTTTAACGARDTLEAQVESLGYCHVGGDWAPCG